MLSADIGLKFEFDRLELLVAHTFGSDDLPSNLVLNLPGSGSYRADFGLLAWPRRDVIATSIAVLDTGFRQD